MWSKKLYDYAWPFATWGLFTWAQMASDRWALQAFASSSAVGRYAVLYQLGYYPITILAGLWSQLIAPIFFGWAGDASDPARVRQVHRINSWMTLSAIVLAVVAAIVAYFVHERVFAWLAAPEYRGVSQLLPITVLSGGLFTAGQNAVLSVLTQTRTHTLIPLKTGVALLAVLLNFMGAIWLGISGVVWAGLVTSSTYLLWALFSSGMVPRNMRQAVASGSDRCGKIAL
jgi:O-antigen/teichoic acid export membrane protein